MERKREEEKLILWKKMVLSDKDLKSEIAACEEVIKGCKRTILVNEIVLKAFKDALTIYNKRD